MANDALKMIKDNDIQFVDFRFTDPKGKWQHTCYVVSQVNEDSFEDGIMFDGSSIAAFPQPAVPQRNAPVLGARFARLYPLYGLFLLASIGPLLENIDWLQYYSPFAPYLQLPGRMHGGQMLYGAGA